MQIGYLRFKGKGRKGLKNSFIQKIEFLRLKTFNLKNETFKIFLCYKIDPMNSKICKTSVSSFYADEIKMTFEKSSLSYDVARLSLFIVSFGQEWQISNLFYCCHRFLQSTTRCLVQNIQSSDLKQGLNWNPGVFC